MEGWQGGKVELHSLYRTTGLFSADLCHVIEGLIRMVQYGSLRPSDNSIHLFTVPSCTIHGKFQTLLNTPPRPAKLLLSEGWGNGFWISLREDTRSLWF